MVASFWKHLWHAPEALAILLDPRTPKAISLYLQCQKSKKESKTSAQVWTKSSAVSVDAPEDVFCCLVTKSCPTLLQPHQLQPARLLYGISQARILEWVAISSSSVSSQPRAQTHIPCVSCIADRFFTHFTIKESLFTPPSNLQFCLFFATYFLYYTRSKAPLCTFSLFRNGFH